MKAFPAKLHCAECGIWMFTCCNSNGDGTYWWSLDHPEDNGCKFAGKRFKPPTVDLEELP